jgi:hypothetical protein
LAVVVVVVLETERLQEAAARLAVRQLKLLLD